MVSRVQLPDHTVDQAEEGKMQQSAVPYSREGCSREVQSVGTQISFSSKGKNVLRSQKRLRNVFGKSVRFGLDSKVGGKFSDPERGWLAQGYFVSVLF